MTRTAGARRRDERGQVTTALVIVVSVALISVAIWGVLLLGRGVDEKSQAQSAADAAALAGAGSLADALPTMLGLLDGKGGLGSLAGCGLGQDRASTYAQKNEARLTSYCFDLGSGRVEASVEMNERVSDDVGPARAEAVATTGLDLSACSWQDDDPPEPTPTPTPTSEPSPSDDPEPSEEPTPEPPPDLGTTLSCGAITAHFVINGTTGLLSFVDVEVHGLEPRLVE